MVGNIAGSFLCKNSFGCGYFFFCLFVCFCFVFFYCSNSVDNQSVYTNFDETLQALLGFLAGLFMMSTRKEKKEFKFSMQ